MSSESSIDKLRSTSEHLQLQRILAGLTSKCLLPDSSRELITLTDADTLSDAVHVLAKNKILSAPVFTAKDDIFVGILDAVAVTEYMEHVHHQVDTHHQQNEALKTIGDTPIGKVLEFDQRSQSSAFFEENPVSLLIGLLATGMHRVVLISAAFEVTNTVSQSDIFQLLSRELSKKDFHGLSSRSLSSLYHFSTKTVFTLPSTATAREGLQKLKELKVSSLAIVNAKNQLLGAFSASDLRGLSDFRDLNLNVLQYLTKYHSASLQPLIIQPSESLAEVVSKMAEQRHHRAWILNTDGVAVGVFSGTDLMQLMSSGDGVSQREANGDVPKTKMWRTRQTVKHVETDPTEFQFSSL